MTPLWVSILTVLEKAQELFMKRILRLFEKANAKRLSRSQCVRLDCEKWDFECDATCLFQWIIATLDGERGEDQEI